MSYNVKYLCFLAGLGNPSGRAFHLPMESQPTGCELLAQTERVEKGQPGLEIETNGGQRSLDSPLQGSYSQSCLRKRKGKKERGELPRRENTRKTGGGGSKDSLDHAKSYYISLFLVLTHEYISISLFIIYLSIHLFLPQRCKGK